MIITPAVKRVALGIAGAATCVAGLTVLDGNSFVLLLGAFAAGVASFNITGKVSA
jgi:hypothetical protein